MIIFRQFKCQTEQYEDNIEYEEYDEHGNPISRQYEQGKLNKNYFHRLLPEVFAVSMS